MTMTEQPTRETPLVTTAQPEDFFQLLKPRVMSLVVFTAVTGLVVAPGQLSWVNAVIAILCIAVGAGAAGALNMAVEGETDALMRRTRGRPVAAGRVRKNDAIAFGMVLSVFSVMLLGMTTNWLAGGLLALTIVYYAWLYTLVLKRRTPQNIVIGGAAGALPPVIGWAAVTGDAPWQAWLLFLIIFMWTPPHTWALTLYSAGDYAKAGIPMMPVARGAKSTRLQILLYSLAFVPVAIAPAFTGLGGPIYLVVSVAGGLGFLALAFRLWRSRAGDQPDKAEAVGREAALYDVRVEAKPARNLFAFSILYLMALFSALLVEHLSGVGV
ncbi:MULTISPECIES: heme o synthase [Brevundimonas]|uniref:heme o synthase n=1 Tax=Brevundimonas TaxID=41275 RepID=UPI000F7B0792|nr:MULTISPECIES: heme o synthase [Brevundimonas]MDA0744532.1 heme o synthase [Pseudomonadota bacterium]MBK1969945.1 protoheme IX farnesyltransferase [Brevundimonas diminuta]MBK1976521.1 protoheme IX farnesyltransferase [Brevundimonas diminuta]MDM8353180.1 heme o synthase [Brevundimonas diminuta]RSB45110.1 protoheme IX farnesyltransferase [Brevundimonas sp. 357]